MVFGSDTRSFLGVVRSLGRQGVSVHVVPFDFSSVALSSRYVSAVHRLPPLQLDAEGWLAELLALCDAVRPDVLIPCDDRTIIPLHHFRDRLAHLRIALPGDAALEAFFDKGNTRRLALNHGVPVSPGRVLAAGDEAGALAREFGLPLYVKPRQSYVMHAIDNRRNVKVCRTVAALQAVLETLDDPQAFLVEGHSEGTGVGVSVLAHRGEISQAFQHRRVREPVDGGGSSYRKSEHVDPELEAMTVALCRASRLEGVAMFEYRVDDATGQKVLLEVNARFWGSLPLAMASGVDFPYLWFRQIMGDAPAPRVRYRVPFYARNLLADMYATAGHLRSLHPGAPVATAWGLLRWLGSLWRFPLGGESLDTLAADDRRPGLKELGQIADRAARRFTVRSSWAARRRRRAARAGVQRAWQQARAEGRPVRLTVACYGNICRSPLAAALLQRRFDGAEPPVSVQGAALACNPGRPSPPRAVEAARRRSVDLSGHRSAYATDGMLQDADLVVVFDAANLALLDSRGLALRNAAVRLGELAEAGHPDIADPVDGDDAMFDRIYDQIESSVEGLGRVVESAR